MPRLLVLPLYSAELFSADIGVWGNCLIAVAKLEAATCTKCETAPAASPRYSTD